MFSLFLYLLVRLKIKILSESNSTIAIVGESFLLKMTQSGKISNFCECCKIQNVIQRIIGAILPKCFRKFVSLC